MAEAIDFIAFPIFSLFLLPISAQKSYVKPSSHISLYKSTISAWRIRHTQSAIMNIEIKKSGKAPWEPNAHGANLLILANLCTTPLL
jgi:hypothetical protein